MSDALLLLELEHRHAEELLRVIEEQLDLEGGPDLDLLASIAGYFRDYPDACHHPVEDRVYRKLAARAPQVAKRIGPLLDDHVALGRLTGELDAAIARAQAPATPNGAALAHTARQFVRRYRAHMHAEETQFFPAALETLTDADWAEIDFDLFDRDDPLFEDHVEANYLALRRYIARRARQSRRRAQLLRTLGRVRRLDSVPAFNALMAKRGDTARLVASDSGSFTLQRDGRTLVDIPPCSPERAAWCAYYYLQPVRAAEVTAA